MTISERILKIRDYYGYSQEKFALTLGLSRNFINQVENGKKNISDRTISDICDKFDVNEEWLRNEIGDMIVEKTKDEQISEMIGNIQKNGEDSFKHRLVSALSKLDEQDWVTLEKLIDLISGK